MPKLIDTKNTYHRLKPPRTLKTISTASIISILLNACGGGGSQATLGTLGNDQAPTVSVPSGYRLLWSDEFDSSSTPVSVNTQAWDFDTGKTGWGNQERQNYTNRLDNAYLKEGFLHLVARPDGQGGYTSARITNRPATLPAYGYYEIRAKLPCGTGAWPAIWLLGDKPTKTNGRYDAGTWPDDGEIDMVEWMSRYFDTNTVQATVHYRYEAGVDPYPSAPLGYLSGVNGKAQYYGAKTTATAVCGDWHTYQLKWTQEKISIGIDGYDYMQFFNPTPLTPNLKKWPFSNPHHLIMNVAVGGNLGGQFYNATTGQKNIADVVDETYMPWIMQIDYVRVYQPS